MRIVKYKTYWAYAGRGIDRQAPLSEFILDIVYLIGSDGVIPPLHVLNEVLQGGGNSGGMGPGTKWRPFKIKAAEYTELVDALLSLDVLEAKKSHPYVYFDEVLIDEELDTCSDYNDWLKKVSDKYRKS